MSPSPPFLESCRMQSQAMLSSDSPRLERSHPFLEGTARTASALGTFHTKVYSEIKTYSSRKPQNKVHFPGFLNDALGINYVP